MTDGGICADFFRIERDDAMTRIFAGFIGGIDAMADGAIFADFGNRRDYGVKAVKERPNTAWMADLRGFFGNRTRITGMDG
jgi:hypothetical protein